MPDIPTTTGPAPPPDAGVARTPADILVVDDNRGKLLALEAALAPLGENVVCANSGRDALHHLLGRDFATVILDVNMPGMDGFETAQMIRSRQRSAGTPIIFTSAISMNDADALRGYSLGAVDYIFAPIIPEVLRAKVAVFVQLHRKSEEARLQAQRLGERTRELERSQRELRLSERMASIGTLCAGLGHDMGNLLLPASVWIDSLRPADLTEEWRSGLENLRACVEYLRKLAGGLRLVSLDPSQEGAVSRVTLAAWADEVGPILRNALPRGVTLAVDVPVSLPPVRIAPHRLAQAAFNLVQNAGEALRERPGGLVRLWARADSAGQAVRVGVSDNGPGMSPGVLARCLDPFFTTKTRGISTGLGLSLVHGIAQAAGSALEVESSRERGTTFSFVLTTVSVGEPARIAAIIDVADPRLRALATVMANAAGCDVIGEEGEGGGRQVALITDRVERAPAGGRGGRAAKVFLLAADVPAGVDGVQPVALTGPDGLASQLRRFSAGGLVEAKNGDVPRHDADRQAVAAGATA